MNTTLANHQLINQTSKKVEYYTPPFILDLARATMGGIELDPASSLLANAYVKAERYFTIVDDGLKQDWIARSVWMNHPFSREGNPKWINKAVEEYQKGNAKQICLICWASTSEKWFQPLFNYPMCFIRGRFNFIDVNRELDGSPTKGAVVVYMGTNLHKFATNFKTIGNIMSPYQ